jgi:cytidine deaminase
MAGRFGYFQSWKAGAYNGAVAGRQAVLPSAPRGAMSDAMTISHRALVERARAAALRAYAPYSGFSVGCAVESASGGIAVGANMENACYRLGICAEISALTAAAQTFGLGQVVRVAVSGGHIGTERALAGRSLVTPCGGCRQAILEAAHVAGADIEVVAANGDGDELRVLRISELIPFGFGPANLADADRAAPIG